MIGVPVPRKARSASTKRSHDSMMSNSTGGGNNSGGEQIQQQQVPASPVRQSLVNAASTPSPSPAAPVSPSSSNASVRKKIKANGANKQQRPPKSSSSKASSSSNPEELEIEIAEVLYGLLTQSQAAPPPKKEILSNDPREVNRSSSDAKSRGSSPISNSPSAANVQSSPAILPPNSISVVAPKRKRPRQVLENPGSYGVRSSPISSTTAKLEADQITKAEISSPNLEKNSGSAAESGYDLSNLLNSQQGLPPAAVAEHPLPEPMKVDSERKLLAEEESRENRDAAAPKEEEVMSSPKMESAAGAVRVEETNREDAATKSSLTVPEVDKQREEKFQIDLEAPPPQSTLSPEGEGEICLGETAINHKPIVSDDVTEMKPVVSKDKQDQKVAKIGKENNGSNVGVDEKKVTSPVEEQEPVKRNENKGKIIDMQLDLEKPESDSGTGSKLQRVNKQQQQIPLKASKEESIAEKTGQTNSLPLPMSMASWPGGLPPMGYIAPIQGVVSMDGATVSPAPIQPFFPQPRPKRCGTHCYIARNIRYLQQLMKNPFWPAAAAAAGSASLFGSKACNLSVVPPADLHGNIAGRGLNNAQDKSQGLAIFPGHGGKDRVSQPANIPDAGQRKQQILLPQTLPPVAAPNSILHGPAFIFPLNHQQAAVAAASTRPAAAKQPPTTSGSVASANASNPATVSASATAGGAAAAVSFNYPNLPTNETQYLAILQNNGYPFPLPAVGAPPNFRGTHPQAMPLFNGSFYSSQIIHHSPLQQQQPSATQSQQMQQNYQNATVSSGSSSSKKHLQSQQQRPSGAAVGSGTAAANMHNFPAPKNRPSQQSQSQNQHTTLPQGRQLENEVGSEDSPSTADSRGSRVPVNCYGQNFGVPIHPPNYAFLTPPAALASGSATGGSSNQGEKKQQQLPQQGVKSVVESLPPQAFAMSFASINGATGTPGIDLSSMAQNHAILQSLPEATRQNIQAMAANAAQVAQQRKNVRIFEDSKTGGDSSNTDDERKGLRGKSPATVGQSIAFSRTELTDAPGHVTAANSVIDSSSRPLNLASAPARSSRPTMPNSVAGVGVANTQLQAQHQPQQIMPLHKHQQQYVGAAAAWSKNPVTSNGSVYPDQLNSSSVAGKFPNALPVFPQNPVQSSSSSPTQSSQWKNAARTSTSQAPSSFAASTTSSLKNLPQQQGRNQQSHSQISFGANQKSSAAPPGQQPSSSNQATASPVMVGSPSTSSISKGASGSPRTTTTASTSSKTGQATALSGQQAKNSSVPGQKSSPVGGRNVPSILGSPHVAVTSSSTAKSQMQQQQQQLAKNMQQAQLFFPSTFMQSQSPNSTSTSSAASAPSGGYYVQRRRPDQAQQPPGSSSTSLTGMLSLCPVSLAGPSTSDPAKAIAAATVDVNNMKGGGLASQSILHGAQFAAQSSANQQQLPPGFAYVHAVPAGVQVKPAEQKQPAGNDNLHACWQPEKK